MLKADIRFLYKIINEQSSKTLQNNLDEKILSAEQPVSQVVTLFPFLVAGERPSLFFGSAPVLFQSKDLIRNSLIIVLTEFGCFMNPS